MSLSVADGWALSYSSTSSPQTSDTLTVQTGDIIVVIGQGASGTTLNTPTNSGAALTWSLLQSYTNGTTWGTVYAWAATADANRSLTVSMARASAGSSSNYGFTAWVIRSSIQYLSVGLSAVANDSSGAPTITMATAQDAVVLFGAVDRNAVGGSNSWRTVNGVSAFESADTNSNNRFYAGRWTGTGTAGTYTYGLSAPTGQKWAAVAVQVQEYASVTATRNVFWDVAQFVTQTRQVAWDVGISSVTATRNVAWDILGKVEVTRQVKWDTKWLGTWREIINTPEWLGMVGAKSRTLSARAELVDRNGNFLQDLVFDTATIDYRGENAEAWAGSVTFTDPAMVPQAPTDVLDPRAGNRARFWWRVLSEGQWFECPVGTLILDDPDIADATDKFGITVTARDILSVVRRTGYGQQVIPVGGVTADVAIKRLFAAVAPWVTVKVPPSSIVLPDAYQLGLDNADPAKDWTKLADLAGWVVRTDRMGTVTVGPRPERAWLVADWQEGENCPVVSMGRQITQSQMFNRVLVRSTAQDAVGVWAVAEDDDPGSPSWVGRFGPFTKVIESDAVKTEDAAEAMAQMQLGRFLRPTESVTVTVPQRPDLEYRDQIALARRRAGVAGIYMVSGWTLSLGPADKGPSNMSVTMMTRSLQ